MSAMSDTPWGKIPLPPRVLPRGAASASPGAGAAIEVSGHTAVALQLIAAHEGVSLSRAVELAVFAYAAGLGATALLDAQTALAECAGHGNSAEISCHGSQASRDNVAGLRPACVEEEGGKCDCPSAVFCRALRKGRLCRHFVQDISND